jgi:epoxide hydrolase
MKQVAEYWGELYDSAAVEEKMKSGFRYFVTTVPGSGSYTQLILLQSVHHRSDDDDGIPLLLLHGRSSRPLERSKVIAPFTTLNFHVVALGFPSIGFSPAPRLPGLGLRELSRALTP